LRNVRTESHLFISSLRTQMTYLVVIFDIPPNYPSLIMYTMYKCRQEIDLLLLELDEFGPPTKNFSLDSWRACAGPNENGRPSFCSIVQGASHCKGSGLHMKQDSLALTGDLSIASLSGFKSQRAIPMCHREGNHFVWASQNTREVLSLCHRGMSKHLDKSRMIGSKIDKEIFHTSSDESVDESRRRGVAERRRFYARRLFVGSIGLNWRRHVGLSKNHLVFVWVL